MTEQDLDLTNSKLILEGDESEQTKANKLINDRITQLSGDQTDRRSIYQVRRDFYVGDHARYSNIVGIQQKEKKGHANAVYNYAGKTVQKIAQKMCNNPPNITLPVDILYKPDDPTYEVEELRTQAVEDFIEDVLKRNKFTKRAYRRGAFNQSEIGDFALKVCPVPSGKDSEGNPIFEIRITAIERMENLLVGWRGDDSKEFDFVIAEEEMSLQYIEEEYGIKVPEQFTKSKKQENSKQSGSGHSNNNQWGTRNVGGMNRALLPAENINVPTALVREYDDENFYAIQIGGKLTQYVKKDGKTYPRMKFWIIGENIPNVGSHWSIADIDYMIDANIELNEASNDERDYVRVGANQKYVAYNMADFDPESVKTGSGGVIFVNDDGSGTTHFEPLQTNVNTYPVDTYLQRVKKHIHDLGVPEVDFGSAHQSSGRSKALDYQSLVDLISFKQDTWELVLTELIEKIQLLGFFYYKHKFFTDAKSDAFKVRYPEFDWSDIVPITQSDKIVNVLNKFQMGLPFKLVFKELGYRDPDAVVNMLKQELKDSDLMILRSKLYTLAPGILAAQQQAGMGAFAPDEAPPPANTPSATLNTSQNEGRESRLPQAVRGGTTSYTSPTGRIAQEMQNQQAQGQ